MSLLRLVPWTFRGGVGLILVILPGFVVLLISFGDVGFGGRLSSVSSITGSSASAVLWSPLKKGLLRCSVSFLIYMRIRLVIKPCGATFVRW